MHSFIISIILAYACYTPPDNV